MGRITRLVLVGLLAMSSVLVGLEVTPADAASPLGCPNLCLTGGLLSLGGRSAAVSGVAGIDAASETRNYSYGWIALDLTEFPPAVEQLNIDISVDGTTTSNTNFQGTGEVDLSSNEECMEMTGITVNDNGLLVTASGSSSGQSFSLIGTVVGGGLATYQADYDYDWHDCYYSD